MSRSILVMALTLLMAGFGRAAPRATGSLSATTAAVGEPVEYELAIEGSEAPDNPPAPNVDGLELRGTSQSSQLSIVNGNVTRRVTYIYTLVPKREGKFTIPELEVLVAGKKLKTQPVTLTVTPGEAVRAAGDSAFAKIWIDKKSAYLGETVPIELRLYLVATSRWELRSTPSIEGDGFTTQPMGKPTQRDVELAGKIYHLASFRTLITPSKAGKLTIGPIPSKLVVSKPARPLGRFDPFGQGFGPAQEMNVEAPAVELLVKPLPADGRPKDFSGAIGKFEFEAQGTPDRVKIGEPVSMKLTIKGQGNFDRIGQPTIEDPAGWKTYSSKQQFDPGDTAGTSGTKTFELPVTPTARKTTMPVFTFSFFDAEAEKYVTLKSRAAPLIVEGEPARIGTNPPQTTAIPPTTQPKAQPVPPAPQDILPNLPELGAAAAGFGLRTPPAVLFGMMFAPLPVILALLAWRSRRRDESAARIASLRREKATLAGSVRNASDRATVLDAAARLLQIEAALTTGQSLTTVDLAQVLASRKLDASGEQAVRELFESRNELHYAGATRRDDRISEGERDRVLETVASYERNGGG
jgi:hypothetical protein